MGLAAPARGGPFLPPETAEPCPRTRADMTPVPAHAAGRCKTLAKMRKGPAGTHKNKGLRGACEKRNLGKNLTQSRLSGKPRRIQLIIRFPNRWNIFGKAVLGAEPFFRREAGLLHTHAGEGVTTPRKAGGRAGRGSDCSFCAGPPSPRLPAPLSHLFSSAHTPRRPAPGAAKPTAQGVMS